MSKLKKQLREAESTFNRMQEEYAEFVSEQDRLKASGDMPNLIKLNKAHAGLDDRVLKAYEELEALRAAVAQAELDYHSPLADRAREEYEAMIKKEYEVVDELLALYRQIEGKTIELHQMALASREAFLSANELAQKAGKPRLPIPKPTVVINDVCSARDRVKQKFDAAYQFHVYKIDVSEVTYSVPEPQRTGLAWFKGANYQ